MPFAGRMWPAGRMLPPPALEPLFLKFWGLRNIFFQCNPQVDLSLRSLSWCGNVSSSNWFFVARKLHFLPISALLSFSWWQSYKRNYVLQKQYFSVNSIVIVLVWSQITRRKYWHLWFWQSTLFVTLFIIWHLCFYSRIFLWVL